MTERERILAEYVKIIKSHDIRKFKSFIKNLTMNEMLDLRVDYKQLEEKKRGAK